jgi:hypothetical protein
MTYTFTPLAPNEPDIGTRTTPVAVTAPTPEPVQPAPAPVDELVNADAAISPAPVDELVNADAAISPAAKPPAQRGKQHTTGGN